MSTNSNDKGRAYEYAWINTIYDFLHRIRATKIVENTSLDANRRAWNVMDEETKSLFEISACSAIETIAEMEPLLLENDNDVLLLEFQSDDAGIHGDVRDIVVKRDDIEWEIGLSIKHNHDAVKHSRLSYGLDFGKSWFDIPCSNKYWEDIKPIFDRLKAEKNKGTKWSEIDDKHGTIYVPLLQAFIDEIKNTYSIDNSMPKKMVEYLIGNKDYYKVISRDSKRLTVIRTFNIHGNLNKKSKVKISAISVPKIELPTELISVKFKTGSTNTVEMYLNNGWQLSFRIHNASSKVEPSLKFDIQFVGTPVSIMNIECKWKER